MSRDSAIRAYLTGGLLAFWLDGHAGASVLHSLGALAASWLYVGARVVSEVMQ